jgi:glyoxylase-like metal-dependent hydrolase (beta-lactamase superfamily II)
MTEMVERWSHRVVRVLAPNPSPMTLEGTNTYVVGEPGADAVVVIDPGPADSGHERRVLEACEGRRVELVLLTHAHHDHAEGAPGLARRVGAPLAALHPAWQGPDAPPLAPGRQLVRGGLALVPVPTPGHAADHCCFLLAVERAMFTGDHILGRGSTVVEWPSGDMGDYLRSLSVLLDYDLERLYPGHGPLVDDAGAKIDEYLDHRHQRERQVLDALAAGDRTPAAVVARVYADVDPALHPAAELSVRAHLVKLVREERVKVVGDDYEPVP